ncbi:MAG: cell division protein FtsQ/DivIB [Burkholderiaceae bacterium]|uniref:Cell division protein FtsQ n=1 Tax=Herminiimonas contaminans TaxID=1111140 RepID=A0ABS0ENJ2_9BURK|nr:cell division protein FtsQ/DivIB [Herminiimonas contaminans]MBF8176424.1 cell division protein FtsQ/DivIB [Herminiimonas contaminans]MBX9799995.1 cell division protein FtsQ/DivIB [Burkholderiaceae bacterium]
MWQDIRTLNATANALFGLVALALVSCCLWWVAQRPYFTLKVIRIEGAEQAQLRHINPLTVRSAVLARIKGNFFTANLDTVRQTFESVPWVRKATIRRDWPNQLTVTLEEHTPLGTWGEDGRLLSTKGDVFTANLAEAEEDANLLTFNGPPGSEKEVVARLNDLNEWFAPLNLSAEALSLSGRYAWTVKLSNGVTVEFGREKSSTTLKERVDRLVGIYPQLLARLQDRIESIDMRYPNGLALKAQGLKVGSDSKKK